MQYCSYYWMYFYNELTIINNVCHEALCHDLFRDSLIITRKFKLHNKDNIEPCTSNGWLLKTDSFLCCRLFHYRATANYILSRQSPFCALDYRLIALKMCNPLYQLHMDFNLPKFFLPNFLQSLFAKVFYHQCFLPYDTWFIWQ